MSATFTIRMEEDEKQRLEALAKSTGRSRTNLAADAICAYLDAQEWQVAAVVSALNSLTKNGGVGHGDVKSWVTFWDETGETGRSKPSGR